ncbi:MAG: hypothetical protein JNM69_04555 [Archangium sp.]|nr:hypothetical protein [Archangium sp.]
MRLAVVFSLILAGTSFAQTDHSSTKKNVPVQTVDFTASDVTGKKEKPVIDFQTVPERPIFKGMIQVRGSFANELHNSVDAIR